MSERITITRHDSERGGEYRAHVPGSAHIARMSWIRSGKERVVDHTIVPQEIGGRGIAAQLVQALVDDARAQGFTIVPQCSYVAAQFRRHPEWADLLAK